MDDDVDFTACRFDFRIDDKNGLTPARRKKAERRPVNYNTLFKCKVCGNLFESRPALLAHKMEHAAFKCEVCGDSFQRKSIWRLHMSKVHGMNMADGVKRGMKEEAPVSLPPPPPPPPSVTMETPTLVAPPSQAMQTTVSASYPNIPGFVCINVPIFITSGEGSSTTVTAMPPGSQPSMVPMPSSAAQGVMPFHSLPSPPVPPLVPPPAPFSMERKSTLEPGELKKPFSAPTPAMGYPMSKPMTTSSFTHIAPINRDLHRGPPSFAEAFKNFSKAPPLPPPPPPQKKKKNDAQIDDFVIDLSVKPKRKADTRDDGSCSSEYDDDKLAMQDQYKNDSAAPVKKKSKMAGGLSKMVEMLWQKRAHQHDGDLAASSPPAVHSRMKSVPRSLSASPAPGVSSSSSPGPSREQSPHFPSIVENAMKRCMNDFTTQDGPSPVIEVAPRPESPQDEDLYDVGGQKTNFCTLKFHTCPTCRQLFSNSEEMRKHQREQHSNKRVRNRGPRNRKRMHCPTCSFVSTSLFRMKHHQVTAHPDRFGMSELAVKPKEVENKVPPTRIKCRFPGCSRVFRELRQLRVHQTLHTCEKPLLCELCDYSCRHKSSLVWHMKNKHADVDTPQSHETQMKAEVKEEPAELIPEPVESFKEPNSPVEKPEKMSKQGELSVYRIDASPGPDPAFFTSVMKFNFNKTPATPSTEEGRQKCTCKACGFSFDNAEEMWQHKMEKHLDDLQFLCDSCEYRTQSRMELQSHMLCTHGNEVGDMKEYLCFICSKGYSSKRGLNNHLMRHSEEGPPGYDCQVPGCKSRLVSKSALRNHVRRVHAKKPVAPVHSAVVLDAAGSEALLFCDFEGCDKSFKEAKHLKVHRMQHTDERPLKCELCFYSCRQRNSMNWHMKSKHGMDKHVTPDGRTIYLATGTEPDTPIM